MNKNIIKVFFENSLNTSNNVKSFPNASLKRLDLISRLGSINIEFNEDLYIYQAFYSVQKQIWKEINEFVGIIRVNKDSYKLV